MNDELIERLDRIEALLLILVDSLADDQNDRVQPELSLDGSLLAGERDQGAPL
ncbi:MAG: hypothetical protein RLZZ555_265 [Pseudomonadota bacterium]|jgi:hypothetical protein